MITNKEVLKAINDCINTRWKPAVKNHGMLPFEAPFCQLCDLFRDNDCEGCPLDLVGKNCMDKGSPFYKWTHVNPTRVQNEAMNMVDTLVETRKHFFGR